MMLRWGKVVAIGGVLGFLSTLAADAALAQWQQFQPYQQQLRRQQREAAAQQQMDAMALRVSGTVEIVQPGGIQMITSAGEAWQLHLTANTRVEVRGQASPAFLAPGQCISFVAKVDKRHPKVEEAVGKLTIFTPDEQHRLGAFPEGPAGRDLPEAGAAGEQAGLGQQPALATAPNAKTKAPARNPRPAAGTAKSAASRITAPTEETFEIAGRISRLKNGEITVTVPSIKPALRLELTEQPQIDVHVWGTEMYRWAQKGDKIQVVGIQLPAAGRVAQAVELTIEFAQPLGSQAEKKPLRRTSRSKGEPPAGKQEPVQVPREEAQQ